MYVNGRGYSRGRISEEHLADHHGTIFILSLKSILACLILCKLCRVLFYPEHASLMKSILKPGAEFDKLLVLGISILSLTSLLLLFQSKFFLILFFRF